MKIQIFTVTWHGHFPLDMLRCDCCFPADSQAVATIDASIHASTSRSHTAQIARYVRSKNDVLTIARWRSFGATLQW